MTSLSRADLQTIADLLREAAALLPFDAVEHVIDRPEEMDRLIAELDAAAKAS